MPCSMIHAERVSKRFGSTLAVSDSTLCVDRGEIVALLGPSGCGKTTLLRLIAGYERPDAGTIELGGRVVAGPGVWEAPERRRVGMVFQDYALFPHLTVSENVLFGVPRRDRRARLAELLDLAGLGGLERRFPHELSGGQQQRVALARALAPSPSVVLLDEPWSNVDSSLRDALRAEVTDIIRPLGVTLVLVTHDREEALSIADRIALMRDGAIVQQGRPEDLYFAPRTRWAAEFVGSANVLSGPVDGGRVVTAIGSFPANGCSGDDAARVLIRPELLGLTVDPAGEAEVVSREFRGHDVFYRLRVNGLEVVSHRPSTEHVPVGARVAIHLHEGPVPTLPVG